MNPGKPAEIAQDDDDTHCSSDQLTEVKQGQRNKRAKMTLSHSSEFKGVIVHIVYRKTYVKRPFPKRQKMVFKTNIRLMQVKSIAEWEHSAILSTFIKLPFVIKICVLSMFEWPFYTGFTVCCKLC